MKDLDRAGLDPNVSAHFWVNYKILQLQSQYTALEGKAVGQLNSL